MFAYSLQYFFCQNLKLVVVVVVVIACLHFVLVVTLTRALNPCAFGDVYCGFSGQVLYSKSDISGPRTLQPSSAIFLCSLDVEILIIITKSQRQYKDYQVGQLANYYLANNQNFAKFVISGQINQSQKW